MIDPSIDLQIHTYTHIPRHLPQHEKFLLSHWCIYIFIPVSIWWFFLSFNYLFDSFFSADFFVFAFSLLSLSLSLSFRETHASSFSFSWPVLVSAWRHTSPRNVFSIVPVFCLTNLFICLFVSLSEHSIWISDYVPQTDCMNRKRMDVEEITPMYVCMYVCIEIDT